MKISRAAVLEPKKVERDRLVAGLKKAGVKVSKAESTGALRNEGLVVVGPSVTGAAKLARAVRGALPDAVLLAAMKKVGKAAWADGVLPLPVSAPDLRVRLPELARLKGTAGAPSASAPAHRPGEGILDPLTGFYTFAHFKEVLFVEVKRARRYNFALSLALIGFDAQALPGEGELRDKLLSGLALAIRRSLRDTDLAVQYSPERVILLMPHTDLQGALVVTGRICDRVARATLQHEDQVLRPTISAGVSGAGAASREFSFGELVKHAQQALERAAAAGGNRVEFSVPDPVEEAPSRDAG
jgi:diguanylate cyclase (GGDEF)-like protein